MTTRAQGRSTDRPRRRVDWEATERDFRTGKFSQTELARKHQVDEATLSRKIKKDRALDPTRWQKDLTEVVRQATNAKLMGELVKSQVKAGQEQVNLTVQAAAELNKQVIVGHRHDIKAVRDLAMALLAEVDRATADPGTLETMLTGLAEGMNERELANAQQALKDLLKLHSRVSSVQRLADTLAKLQVLERKAFGLDEEGAGEQDGNKTAAQVLREFFFSQLHSSGRGRVQVVKSEDRPLSPASAQRSAEGAAR